MRRWFTGLVLASAFTGMLVSSSFAQNVQPQPAQAQRVQAQPAQVQPAQPNIAKAQVIQGRVVVMPNVQPAQLLQADAVVVGRVIGLEPVDVAATPAANQAKVNYRIAVVQVSEVIHGVKKDIKMVRVGFIAAPMNGDPNGGVNGPGGIQIQILPAIQPGQPVPPFGAIRRPFPGYGNVALQVGQDGLFMLAKHHNENFYLVPNHTSFVASQNNANFETEVKNAKLLGTVLDNPTVALKSDDRQQRHLAAAVLISKYRSNPTGQPTKQVPIDAAESKLILKALATSDWNVNRTSVTIPTAQELFNQLGINATNGYTLVNNSPQAVNTAMQKWLSENESKYIINKLVVDPNAKLQPAPPNVLPPGVEPGILPLPIKKGKGIKGGVLPVQPQPLPAPAPPLQIQPIQIDPVQGIPQALPIRRE